MSLLWREITDWDEASNWALAPDQAFIDGRLGFGYRCFRIALDTADTSCRFILKDPEGNVVQSFETLLAAQHKGLILCTPTN